MAEYSGFKIKRPHSLAPLTSVYEAEAVDGRPGRFALKIFHPPASTHVRRFYAVEGWLLAAERQQQAAKKDGTVVEVLACGRCAEGAFAVMPWQEHFLEPWIKTLGPKGNTLRALAECLLNTIEAWEKETGGPHGNLKASNVFLKRTGPLVGMTAKLSDPAFLPGAKTEALQLADLNAVGTMLATIVRRRPPGAWPIEDAPEWKALGNAGKGWLDFCNYLLNPQPGEGELTLAKARLRLKKVPKDANPVKTAVLSLAAVLVLGVVGVVAFARFGNFIYMPEQLQRLAVTLDNPSVPRTVPPTWAQLCAAWDTWLVDMQSNGGRLLRTKDLLEQNDPLHIALADFMAKAKDLRPEALVTQAAGEKRLGVLGSSPPKEVFDELQIQTTKDKVDAAGKVILELNTQLENWQRWDQLRALQKLMNDSGYAQAAGALATHLPPARGSAEYGRQNVVRTLKFFNDLSLDTATLPLATRWNEMSQLKDAMEQSGDRIQVAMPGIILQRLEDKSSLSDFADSLEPPLEEMRLRRKQFLDPQVVRERFLKESELQTETAPVTVDDIKKWEEELVQFTLVARAENPSWPPTADAAAIDASEKQLAQESVDLEDEAPEGEPGQVTLSKTTYTSASDGLKANLQALRNRPIVRRDLPGIVTETATLKGQFLELVKRLTDTLILLKPETWLAKVRPPVVYGTFTESRRRWADWQRTTVPDSVTAASLKGSAANRATFLRLRESERDIKAWINGLEGPEGFGALKVPNLAGTASAATAAELKRLEAVLRDRAATAIGAATEWRGPLAATTWAAASGDVKKPLEAHRVWLGQLTTFASELDQLSDFLTNGFGLNDGVSEVAARLRPRPGTTDLAGKPAEWYAEANQLAALEPVTDRAGLLAAASGGRLSQKLTVWRRLGQVDGWPTGATDFDLDGKVVGEMRQLVRAVKDEARRTSLLEEMVKGTRLRFNRAASTAANSAANSEAQLTEMFTRMPRAGLKEADLDEPVAFNLALWNFKRSDWKEKNLDRLRVWRDNFVSAVRRIGGGSVAAQPVVAGLLTDLSSLELKDDPKRPPTTSPATAGWQEVLTGELSLTATWKGSGARSVPVVLEYNIVQPLDDTPPFYLATRVIAVGEFLTLVEGHKEGAVVKAALPAWALREAAAKPYDRASSWRPRADFTAGVLELNPEWIYAPTALVRGLLDNTELRAANPPLEQAATEKPTLRSPLQQVTSTAAKHFAEKVLGARLPTTKEWRAVINATGATAASGYFRGPNFEKLFLFAKDYEVRVPTSPEPVKTEWRPSTGGYYPTKAAEKSDSGQANPKGDGSRLWFHEVDDGPKSGAFINLTGNVSIFLAGETPEKFYVAGGSIMSPPGIDFTEPQEIGKSSTEIGGRAATAAFSDVGVRPAFDAPPGFKEWFKLNQLVRNQRYLTL